MSLSEPGRVGSPESGTPAPRRLILVAHAAHRDSQLTPRGEHQLRRLINGLRACDVQPGVILSSCEPHAWATADYVRKHYGSCELRQMKELTPRTPTVGTYPALEQEYRGSANQALPREVLIVGHEGRLSNMVTELTGSRTRPLFNGDMIVVEEPKPGAFGWGAGTVVGRWPVAAHLEDELREKLASKMTVTALLAGFVLTALVELAVNIEDFDGVEGVSVGLLTLSLCLLIASVYIYD